MMALTKTQLEALIARKEELSQKLIAQGYHPFEASVTAARKVREGTNLAVIVPPDLQRVFNRMKAQRLAREAKAEKQAKINAFLGSGI
jgi:hypothetical protein